jgi:3-hydroxyacyl-[acyl-carrier-protein] dehydratase
MRAAWREPVCIDADHPSLPGHFPGRPVVPGVVLLDRIADALERREATTLRRLAAVKFLAPLLPGEVAELVVEREAARVRFRVERAGAPILRGEGECA